MAVEINVITIKDIPTEEITNYMDTCMFGIARATLDFTNTGQHFPYLTGELNRASMAEGVVQQGYCDYVLGAAGCDYAPKVYEYTEKTHWTNPSTYAHWYNTEFEKDKNIIIQSALKQAEGVLK